MRPLTAQEVAELLGIHVNTVKRIPPEDLPFFRIGQRGDRRYEVAHVTRYKRVRTHDR